MAVTKILARKGSLSAGINYILNGEKTENRILTATVNCDPGREARQMMDTKQATGKMDGVQYYHIIQSYKPGEISPEQAMEIAQEFVEEHLPGYEAVIAVHTDRKHIHAHIVFNSVNAETGKKYHSNARSYYQQIREISDRLCRQHGLSVVEQRDPSRTVSYIEWLRQSKGQPTFRSMLEADLRTAMDAANDLGEFFMLMEHMGYEIRHGNRLGFRLHGQERFMYPERKNALFSETGILSAIQGNLEAVNVGRSFRRTAYQPYRKHPKYTGFLALYVHYLYLLGKIGRQEYPPKMTPEQRAKLKAEQMRFDRYREQFLFLRDNEITTADDLSKVQRRSEEKLADLMKQRTILNVRKKKHQKLYQALADAEALAPVKVLQEEGASGFEAEFARYMDAVQTLDGLPKEKLTQEKAQLYEQLAELNRQIRAERKKLALCLEIRKKQAQIEQELQSITVQKKREVRQYERGRR